MRKDDEVAPCIRKVPDYEVRDGIMFVSAGDWSCCMPLRIFKLGAVKAAEAIARYEAERGEVVPLRQRK